MRVNGSLPHCVDVGSFDVEKHEKPFQWMSAFCIIFAAGNVEVITFLAKGIFFEFGYG